MSGRRPVDDVVAQIAADSVRAVYAEEAAQAEGLKHAVAQLARLALVEQPKAEVLVVLRVGGMTVCAARSSDPDLLFHAGYAALRSGRSS